MTTRTASVASALTASEASVQLALSPPGTDDAVAMLLAGAELQQEERGEETRSEDVEHLVRSVGHLPLAIDQAASYMRETGSRREKILELYRSDEMPEVSGSGKERSERQGKEVWTTTG